MTAGNGTQPTVDRSGRRALFSAVTDEEQGQTPVPAPTSSSRGEGRQAVFSAASTPDAGAVVVTCSVCAQRSSVPVLALWRHLVPSLWAPVRRDHPVWMHCPSCGRHTWCRLDATAALRALRRRR